MHRERSSAYAKITPGIAGVSDTVTAVPYWREYSRSISSSAWRSRSRGISCSRRGPHAVRTHPAAAAAAHVANFLRVTPCEVPAEGWTLSSVMTRPPADPDGRRLWLQRGETRLVRIVTVRTEQVRPVPVPLTRAPAVDPRAPIAQLFPVALSAEPVRLVERQAFASCEVQN